MIQPNEIRLNNWVHTQKGTYKQIKDICEDGSVWLRCNLCVKAKYRHELEGLHPIPLTEDILLKCKGVVRKESNCTFCYSIGDFEIYLPDCGIWDNGKVFYKSLAISDARVPLHRLQNIIFDLTNQELEIEL